MDEQIQNPVPQPMPNNPLNTGMGAPQPTPVAPMPTPYAQPIPVQAMPAREQQFMPPAPVAPVAPIAPIAPIAPVNPEVPVTPVGNKKKKMIIIGVLSGLVVIALGVVLFMVFSGGETPTKDLPTEKNTLSSDAPPAVQSPFEEEAPTTETATVDIPELTDTLEKIEETAPPALDLMEEQEPAPTPVKRVTR